MIKNAIGKNKKLTKTIIKATLMHGSHIWTYEMCIRKIRNLNWTKTVVKMMDKSEN